MTNAEIVVILNTFGEIKKSDRKLPIKLSYAINKNFSALITAYKPFEDTLKEKGLTEVEKLNEEEMKELQELRAAQIDVDMYKVKLEDILTADLTINELEVIQVYMLDDENKE